MSGMEIMLKSMGLGDVIQMAKDLQTNGTLEKIVRFTEELEVQNALMREVRDLLHDIRNGHTITALPGSERSLVGNGIEPDRLGMSDELRAD